jgi:putative PIN family toxin of toxin-antitoxin system
MRVVLDTNVLVSALISPSGPTDVLYQAWRNGRFALVTSLNQLDEFRRVTRYPRLASFLSPVAAGTMLNEIRLLAAVVPKLPKVSVCRDPDDNFFLAMAQGGRADYLVTGDRQDLLPLQRHGHTRIVSVRRMLTILGD